MGRAEQTPAGSFERAPVARFCARSLWKVATQCLSVLRAARSVQQLHPEFESQPPADWTLRSGRSEPSRPQSLGAPTRSPAAERLQARLHRGAPEQANSVAEPLSSRVLAARFGENGPGRRKVSSFSPPLSTSLPCCVLLPLFDQENSSPNRNQIAARK